MPFFRSKTDFFRQSVFQIMAKHLSFFLLILGAGLISVNAFGGQPLQRFTFSEPHMGTTVTITGTDSSGAPFSESSILTIQ